MGGNALKNTNTRRYAATEYYALYKGLAQQINTALRPADLALIPSYRAKETFGDMDILYSGNAFDPNMVKSVFSPTEIVSNGEVISFDYQELQIDLINTKTMGYSLAYYSYNDLGNLIGKLARRFGLKHGHTGLRLPLRYGDHFTAEILVTTNHREALEFLDLDVDRFDAGFEDLQEIFEYVASSRYFNPNAYKLENISAKGRVRDRKRSTYQAFLQFCENCTQPILEMNDDKMFYLPTILKNWPHIRQEFDKVTSDIALLAAADKLLNRRTVAEMVGIPVGPELGQLMQSIRKHELLSDRSVLMHLEHATIQQIVKDLYARSNTQL